jgi:phage/plasmid-associated DNA primase
MENGNMCVVKALKTSDLKFKFKQNPITLSAVLSLLPNSFKSISCKLIDCPENEFNIWSGFQAQLVNIPESNECLRMKQFIMEVWANNNLEVYNHIINWFAGLVQNLSGINQMALVMVAPQGTGKNTLTDFMKLILRSCNCAMVEGIGEVVGRFNTILQGKRLVVVNELCSTKDEFKSNFDKIKSKITDSTIGIEPKGVNKYEIDNIGNYILFTNHRDSLIIEASDRRYSIHEMSDCKINNKEYFTNLRKDCFNQSVANEFYTYLMSVQLVPCVPMMTDIRLEMMNMSKSTPLKFLDAVKDGNFDIFTEDETEVSSTVLYNSYRRWCEENGERLVITSTKFGTIISTKLQKKRTNQGNVYVL